SALFPNQGKQMGTPPRMARPSAHLDAALTNSTSSAPRGFHEVTSDPSRYISPAVPATLTPTFGSPPFPSSTRAALDIPKRRSNSAIVPVAPIAHLRKCKHATRIMAEALPTGNAKLHPACREFAELFARRLC